MKKAIGVLLAVVWMAMMILPVSAGSLLPPDASDFSKQDGDAAGNGTITVTANGDGYTFVSDQGWPSAYYVDEAGWLYFNEADDVYLNYDFEVVSGAANIIVYFAGQSPTDQASPGSFISLNGLVDPNYVNSLTGDAVVDLPIGKYQGSVKITDLGYREDLKSDEGDMLFSGCKVFAVGGEVIVNTLAIEVRGDAPLATSRPTTVQTAPHISHQDNPKTGESGFDIQLPELPENAWNTVLIVIAAVVTLAVVVVVIVLVIRSKRR